MIGLFVMFILVQPAWSQSFEVIEIRPDIQELVLRDAENGSEFVVRPGDLFQGWNVVRINPDTLTVSFLGEDNIIYVTKVPLRLRTMALPPATK